VPERLNQVRIDTQQADAVLACDMVVAASPEALQTVRHGRTRIVTNVHEIPVAESLKNPDADLKSELLLAKLRFAAGDDRVETFDAQSLAEEFLGDTVTANILAMGYAWQRGLIPIGLPAMQRAIELNGVAVESNRLSFALGRLAAGKPDALRDEALASPPDESLEGLIARGVVHLTAYQDARWAERFEATVRRVQRAERACANHDASLPMSCAAARSLMKLMSYKDEYEVARLYTDGGFQRQLADQFEGALKLEFHMAPPLLARPKNGQPPKKIALGAWMLPAMKWLAKGRSLRGGWLDVFGHTEERRMERGLIGQFEHRLDELIGLIAERPVERLPLAVQIASLPLSMRGYGHVKIANVALARAREAELLHRFDPSRYAKPAASARAGQFRGIAVVASR
jgi:indolepyruvate ferredoxin oxidoreductase